MGCWNRLGLAAVAMAATLSGPAVTQASVVVGQYGGMDIEAGVCVAISYTNYGGTTYGGCDDHKASDRVTGQPTALSASTSATASNAFNSAFVSIDANSHWDSPDSGEADVNSVMILGQGSAGLGAGVAASGHPSWEYAFTAN